MASSNGCNKSVYLGRNVSNWWNTRARLITFCALSKAFNYLNLWKSGLQKIQNLFPDVYIMVEKNLRIALMMAYVTWTLKLKNKEHRSVLVHRSVPQNNDTTCIVYILQNTKYNIYLNTFIESKRYDWYALEWTPTVKHLPPSLYA